MHLVDWRFWTKAQIIEVVQLAQYLKKHRWEFQGRLQGRTLVMLFQKTSTRTRVSFEAAMTEMSGHAIYMDWLTSNFTLSDIRFEAKYLCRNASIIMARLKNNADLNSMWQASSVPVINGCCNMYHPCQTLADMLTILEDRQSLKGTKLTYIGVYNNVVNSLVSICAPLEVELTLVCPIRAIVDEQSRENLLQLGLLKETLDAQKAVKEAEYVYTDTWVDMEWFNDSKYQQQKEERISQMQKYQVNEALLKESNAKILHDMPIHSGYEISATLVEDPRSLIFEQAENRLDAQKAIMIRLLELG